MKLNKFVLLALTALLALSLVAVSGCTPKAEEPTDSVAENPVTTEKPAWSAELITPGTITIGADTNYPPFEFSDGAGGFQGFDVDLMTEIASKLNMEFEFKTYNFDSLIAGLTAAQDFDMVMSAWTITEERAANVNFSEPYFQNSFGVVVPSDSTLTSVDELKEGGVIAVQTGSSAFEWANKELAPKGIELKTFPDTLDSFNALTAGDAVMAIQDLTMAVDVAKDEARGIKVIEEIPVEEFFGLGFQKNELGDAMKADVQAALGELVADGTYAEIYEKWFTTEPTFLPQF